MYSVTFHKINNQRTYGRTLTCIFRTIKTSGENAFSCMIHKRIWGERYSRKWHRLGEGVTVKSGRTGVVEEKKGITRIRTAADSSNPSKTPRLNLFSPLHPRRIPPLTPDVYMRPVKNYFKRYKPVFYPDGSCQIDIYSLSVILKKVAKYPVFALPP